MWLVGEGGSILESSVCVCCPVCLVVRRSDVLGVTPCRV